MASTTTNVSLEKDVSISVNKIKPIIREIIDKNLLYLKASTPKTANPYNDRDNKAEMTKSNEGKSSLEFEVLFIFVCIEKAYKNADPIP